MIPHERSLVAKMEGRPFALVGVNNDQGDVSARLQESKITWRSFKDPGSAISRRLGVNSFPSLILIDEKGVIQKVWKGSPGNAALDAAIEEYTKKAEGK